MSITDLTQRAMLGLDALKYLGLGLCVVDQDLIIRECNRELQMHGFSMPESIGASVRDVLGPYCLASESIGSLEHSLRRALTGQPSTPSRGLVVVLNEPVHTPFQLIALPLLSDQGERLAALVFLDAGEPTAVRREYERVLDSTPDGIMVIDLNRRVRIFNQACGHLLGRDPNDVIGTGCVCGEVTSCHAADGTSFHSQLCPALDLFRFGGPPRQEQMLCTNVHGEERWVETTYSPIYDAEGNVEFVIGVMRDIHERKLLEQRLRQSEKLASLGQLTAGIAHEIKNPLGVILSSVELILDENRPSEMRRHAAEFIKDEVQRLDSRLRAFLAFARPQPMMPEPVVLNGLVRRTAEMFQSATMGVDLQLDLEQPETILHVDPDQFQQVLSNLIINATEAMQNEGTIRIRTRSDLDHLLLEIEDDGPGVPEEIRKKVLDPFFTTKAHGTGLGLSIVCQIVSAHQGTVTIGESPSLGGARFRIVLPPGIRSS